MSPVCNQKDLFPLIWILYWSWQPGAKNQQSNRSSTRSSVFDQSINRSIINSIVSFDQTSNQINHQFDRRLRSIDRSISHARSSVRSIIRSVIDPQFDQSIRSSIRSTNCSSFNEFPRVSTSFHLNRDRTILIPIPFYRSVKWLHRRVHRTRSSSIAQKTRNNGLRRSRQLQMKQSGYTSIQMSLLQSKVW